MGTQRFETVRNVFGDHSFMQKKCENVWHFVKFCGLQWQFTANSGVETVRKWTFLLIT